MYVACLIRVFCFNALASVFTTGRPVWTTGSSSSYLVWKVIGGDMSEAAFGFLPCPVLVGHEVKNFCFQTTLTISKLYLAAALANFRSRILERRPNRKCFTRLSTFLTGLKPPALLFFTYEVSRLPVRGF